MQRRQHRVALFEIARQRLLKAPRACPLVKRTAPRPGRINLSPGDIEQRIVLFGVLQKRLGRVQRRSRIVAKDIEDGLHKVGMNECREVTRRMCLSDGPSITRRAYLTSPSNHLANGK